MVPTVPASAFSALINPYAGACPDPMIEQAIRLAAVEFCERTRCWRHIVTKTVRRSESIVVAPAYSVIHEFETAYFNGAPLTPIAYSAIQEELINDTEGTTSQPEYISQANPGTVQLWPFMEGELKLTCFLKPASVDEAAPASPYDDDEEQGILPEFLRSQFGEAIAAGALSRILSIPNQSYTDPGQAANYLARFERAMDRNFGANIKGQHRVAPRTRPVYF